MIERRYLAQEFRVSDGAASPTISGYAAVFNVPSEDLGWIEEIDPHAFDAVLASKPDCRCLWNHNADHVLGRTTSGTLRLTVDKRGLAYEVDAPETTTARDLIISMRRGDVTQSSFGFICARDQWTDNKDGSVSRRILEVSELLDVSPVTYPAFTQATSGVRSLPESMPMEIRSMLEKRASEKPLTKKVDGEDLTLDCFAYRGSETETADWKLPIHFATVAKTISHIRNAIAMYSDTIMPDKAEAKKAWTRIKGAAAAHDIEISADDARSIDKDSEQRAMTEQCTCTCSQCMSGACGICSADPQCAGAERIQAEEAERSAWKADMELRLRLAEA